MREFWVSSGHHMTLRRPDGQLAVTDELLLAYLARPEILPPADACVVERALHQRLLADPRSAVDPATIDDIADEDARENWTFLLGYRDLLLEEGTVEKAYLRIVREGRAVPPLFLNQLVHLILRNALEGCDDPHVLRAAELFYRPQRATVRDGALLLADAEFVEELENERKASPLQAMFAEGETPEIDVMDEENAWTYWSRSDAHSMAMNWGGSARARTGLAVAIAVLIDHLLDAKVKVEPLLDVKDAAFRWFVGLDADATMIGNGLWRGADVPQEAMERLIGLFRLTFVNSDDADPRVAGEPVYLLLAMARDRTLRVKPQNIVMGLPLKDDASGGGVAH